MDNILQTSSNERHFAHNSKCIALNEKCFYLDSNFIEVFCSTGLIDNKSIGAGVKHQAITLTNVDKK